MKTPIRPLLRDLQIGDKFHAASSNSKRPLYEVKGRLKFNIGFGSATRECINLDTKKTESKSGRLEVVKLYYCQECGTRVPDRQIYCNECVIV